MEELHAQLPVGLLVNDADTLEILHASPPLPGFADHELRLPTDALAALVAEVASSGSPQHIPEFRHDSPGHDPNWWSATLRRIDTERWGQVVVTLAVDTTNQVRARHLLEERERWYVALRQQIAAVPGQNLVTSLQQVADALVPALQADVAAIRILGADAKLHLVAASGFRPSEIRRLALDPITIRRLETMSQSAPPTAFGSLGLHWVEVRWLEAGGDRVGNLTIGSRSKRRPPEDDLTLLNAASVQLGHALENIERSPQFLRSRSLEVARVSTDVGGPMQPRSADLRPRELAILRLYDEGLRTDQIAELLVLSPHTVRTHVRNVRRRLGVSSRAEALDLLKAAEADPSV
ncbi:MAG TPA: LuxR C-terminal-related transcriptional regulator [Solirubrobacterales bacterium]|nr:LuxR C-terminal-related transcriptional regulator [Solirubrobacterales bacterium]